jgi:hypothetical protein
MVEFMVARIVVRAPILTSLTWRGAATAEPRVRAAAIEAKNLMFPDAELTRTQVTRGFYEVDQRDIENRMGNSPRKVMSGAGLAEYPRI